MPFNSGSTTPLRRIISQRSWLFLLSHGSLSLSLSPHCKMNHESDRLYPRGRTGELCDLADQSRAWETDTRTEAALLLLKETSHLVPSAAREASTKRPVSGRHLCVSLCTNTARKNLNIKCCGGSGIRDAATLPDFDIQTNDMQIHVF